MAHHISPLQETARAFFVPMALRHACCRPPECSRPGRSLRPFGLPSCFDLLQKIRSRSPAAQDQYMAGSPAPQVLTSGLVSPSPFPDADGIVFYLAAGVLPPCSTAPLSRFHEDAVAAPYGHPAAQQTGAGAPRAPSERIPRPPLLAPEKTKRKESRGFPSSCPARLAPRITDVV